MAASARRGHRAGLGLGGSGDMQRIRWTVILLGALALAAPDAPRWRGDGDAAPVVLAESEAVEGEDRRLDLVMGD
jgi:hypothetical protein